MKTELGKMANEGFLFAKLPQIYNMPQLQYWIYYRIKGSYLSKTDKGIQLFMSVKPSLLFSKWPIAFSGELLKHTILSWGKLTSLGKNKVTAPPLKIARAEKLKMNYDRAMHYKRTVRKKEINPMNRIYRIFVSS